MKKQDLPKEVGKGQLFVNAKLSNRDVQALLDTGASNNFLKLEEAKRIGVEIEKTEGWIKAVNSKPSLVHGMAKDVRVQIGEWRGTLNFSVVSMDDYLCVLGMEFMDQVKAIPIPFANIMCIMEEGKTCAIPLRRVKPNHGSTISAIKEVPTNAIQGVLGGSKPKEVQVLTELLKRAPPREKVGYAKRGRHRGNEGRVGGHANGINTEQHGGGHARRKWRPWKDRHKNLPREANKERDQLPRAPRRWRPWRSKVRGDVQDATRTSRD